MLLKELFYWNGANDVHLPTMTFAASINAVLAAGHKPIIEDVDQNCHLVRQDVNVELQVSFGGKLVDFPADYLGLTFYDQAHSIQPGTFKKMSVWSFYSNKNIGCGEGGLIGCHKDMARTMRAMRDHGRISTYEVRFPGSLNFRMAEIQAAILREQIKKLPWMIARKQEIASLYREQLQDERIVLPPEGVTHLFWIRVPERDHVKTRLGKDGIETSIHYKPLHHMEAYKRYAANKSFPIADKIAAETLSLPFWPEMSLDQVQYVCDRLLLHLDQTDLSCSAN